ncbi:hypothetical protein EVAR_13040_1 [Eumeta japonica]|uniref:Uncharacterized protein n=1 Tax=Eumeta variegata TaxID=151549 RepID=A0A4C1VHC1_EUMVA|nr:hypothetical protein EVAR_13040_1 [Eumeta japonica]
MYCYHFEITRARSTASCRPPHDRGTNRKSSKEPTCDCGPSPLPHPAHHAGRDSVNSANSVARHIIEQLIPAAWRRSGEGAPRREGRKGNYFPLYVNNAAGGVGRRRAAYARGGPHVRSWASWKNAPNPLRGFR